MLEHHSLAEALDEEALAADVGISASQLRRIFMLNLGATPHRYLDGLRRREACQRLSHSSVPIKQIATDLGFRHGAHFSNWFHRHEGCGPRAWRQRAAAASEPASP